MKNKKDLIVVFQNTDDTKEFSDKVKAILPSYLKVNLTSDNYADLLYLTFDSEQTLPDFSYGNTAKEVLEQYLIDNDFDKWIYFDLDKVKKSLENIKTNFIDKILEDTPYLDTKNLFYMSPMSEWSKKDINQSIKQTKSVEKDFAALDYFLNIDDYVSKKETTKSFYHDINCEIAANNFRGASHLISNLEDRFKEGELFLKQIEESVKELSTPDEFIGLNKEDLNDINNIESLDEVKNLVEEHQKEIKPDTNLKR